MGKSKQKRKSAREPQLSANSTSDRNRSKLMTRHGRAAPRRHLWAPQDDWGDQDQNKSRTSTILVPTGDQDPTVNLTQSFWMAVDPPISVTNHI